MDLILHLKGPYFHQIKGGEKKYEYRLVTEYWRKRLVGRDYERILFMWGYPKKDDFDRIVVRPWRQPILTEIQHPEFGDRPVTVFAIPANDPTGAAHETPPTS